MTVFPNAPGLVVPTILAAMTWLPAGVAAEVSTGSLRISLSAPAGAAAAVWAESSLVRVYPKSPEGTSRTAHLRGVRNQRLSLQICIKNDAPAVLDTACAVGDPESLGVRIRRVGYVPVDHLTPNTPADELDGIGHLPGLVPDPLFPDNRGTAGPFENLCYWITVTIPGDAEPGRRELSFDVQLGKDRGTSVTAIVDISPVTIGKRKNFPVTHWWRPDTIFLHYKQKPWSDEWFQMTEKYVRNMVDHGTNVMFVPAIEGRRENFRQPMQMLRITRNGDQWTFDFDVVRRFVRMAKLCGMEYFEWPHLWLYWGVKHAIPVYTTDAEGRQTRVWSADADGFSSEYLNFMKQFLRALHQFLQEEKILENSFFHLSDEPNLGGPESIGRYEKARGILRDYAPWMKVMDALSDINYAKKGITDIPVPIIDTAKPYMEAGMPHWVYYCCGPTGRNLNRFLDTPLTKIRTSGWLFYRLKAGGFLHWAYNYWYRMDTDELLDPFRRSDAMAWPNIPYGDPFVVYPGPDGPIDSIRWEIFAESLQDYALLQTLGVSPDDSLLAPLRNYDDFPKTEVWIQQATGQLLDRKPAAE